MRSRRELDAFIEELRAAHWALQRPLRAADVRQLLKDQEIPLNFVSLPVPAMTTMQWGIAAIALNTALRVSSHTAVLAEEYAHAMLHRDEPGELTIHLSAAGPLDPREYEADYVARALLAGPGVEVAYFTPPKPTKTAAKPARIPWWLDPRADPYLHPYSVGPSPAPIHWTEKRGPRIRRRVPKDKLLPGVPAIVYGKLFGPTFYRDTEGVKWELHDVSADIKDGRIVRLEVPLESPRTIYRYFIGPTERRAYRFARWESREVVLRRLTMQLRESKVMPTRTRVSSEKFG